MRSVLSLYADVEPGRWIFRANRYGKPEIQESMNDSGIRFNLSHTDDLIVCGVVLKHDIGVDVENIERQSKTIEIAKRFFSPEESADIENLGEKEGKRRFFSYWTLKESYIKACGMGLALPLNRFAFRLGKNDAIRISFASDLNDDPEKWQFKLFDPTPIHTTAVSVERPPGESYEFSTWQIVPLASKRPIICEL